MKELSKSDLIKNIFREIEEAMRDSLSSKPVKLKNSKFYKRFKEIKKKYGTTKLTIAIIIISLGILPFISFIITIPLASKFLIWVR